MAEVQQMQAKALTKFGALVLAFATEAGATQQKQIAALVSEKSPETIAARRLSTWLHGEHEPPWWFCEAFADTFELTDEQMDRLARAHTFGLKTKVV